MQVLPNSGNPVPPVWQGWGLQAKAVVNSKPELHLSHSAPEPQTSPECWKSLNPKFWRSFCMNLHIKDAWSFLPSWSKLPHMVVLLKSLQKTRALTHANTCQSYILEQTRSHAAPSPETHGEGAQTPSVRVKPSLQAVHWWSAVRNFKSLHSLHSVPSPSLQV